MDNDGDAIALLRDAELRVTRPRVAVLAELERQPHADVETITAAVRTRLGSVSTQAVYDVLGALTDAGLVRRIEPARSPARFEIHVGDNHHHLVCRGCGKIVDVECAVGARPCLHPSEQSGFEIDEAEVIYWGRCQQCAASESSSTAVPAAASHPISSPNNNGGSTP